MSRSANGRQADSEEHFNVQLKKKTKHRTPEVEMKGPTYCPRGHTKHGPIHEDDDDEVNTHSNIPEPLALQIQRSRVRFPALPDFLRSSGSGTGSTQPREDN
jgi:hypothetical protein